MRVKLIAHLRLVNDIELGHNAYYESESEFIATTAMTTCQSSKDFIEVAKETETQKIRDRANGVMKVKPYPHFTVPGFTEFVFEIRGVSRALTHQLVRTRTGWYLQQSQRSVDPTKEDIWYIVPPMIDEDTTASLHFHNDMALLKEKYLQMIKKGIPKEDARYILPNATKSNVIMKIDGSNLMHFLKLRKDSHAQWEIRELAHLIHEEVKHAAPNLFSDEHEDRWW